jgi:hypothetical protein
MSYGSVVVAHRLDRCVPNGKSWGTKFEARQVTNSCEGRENGPPNRDMIHRGRFWSNQEWLLAASSLVIVGLVHTVREWSKVPTWGLYCVVGKDARRFSSSLSAQRSVRLFQS